MDRDFIFSRVVGTLYGLAIGDALAKPVLSLSPYEIICKYQVVDAFYPDKHDPPAKNSVHAKNAFVTFRSLFEKGKIEKEELLKVLDLQKQDEISFLLRIIPLSIMLSFEPFDDIQIVKQCKEMCLVTEKEKSSALACFVIAKIITSCIRQRKELDNPSDLHQKDRSLLARIILAVQEMEKVLQPKPRLLLSDRLIFTRRKLQSRLSVEEFYGLNGSKTVDECVAFSIFTFFKAPGSFETVTKSVSMGGPSCINGGLVGAMVGCYGGNMLFPEDLRENVENSSKIPLWSENFIDKFFKED